VLDQPTDVHRTVGPLEGERPTEDARDPTGDEEALDVEVGPRLGRVQGLAGCRRRSAALWDGQLRLDRLVALSPA
jgi:hypothetical protein